MMVKYVSDWIYQEFILFEQMKRDSWKCAVDRSPRFVLSVSSIIKKKVSLSLTVSMISLT